MVSQFRVWQEEIVEGILEAFRTPQEFRCRESDRRDNF